MEDLADAAKPLTTCKAIGSLPPNSKDNTRIHIAVWTCILWAVHNRLANCRRSGKLDRQGAERLEHIQRLLRLRFDDRLADSAAPS